MKFYWPKFGPYGGGGFERMPLFLSSKLGISVHKIPSEDPPWLNPHDHGCDFFSFILKGGYTEKVYNNPHAGLDEASVRTHRRFFGHTLKNEKAHRIIKATPGTITLFVTWNHLGRPPWTFSPRGHMSYADYYGKGLHMQDRVTWE